MTPRKVGYYPPRLPSEHILSCNARFQSHLGINSIRMSTALYGKDSYNSIDFPSYLSHLIEVIPEGMLNIEDIIYRGTLYPLFSPFLTEEQARSIKAAMIAQPGQGIYPRTTSIISPFKLPKYLRFCPLCVTEHRSMYGETYWNRDHQAPGIIFCLLHEVYLVNSNVYRSHTYMPPADSSIGELKSPLKIADGSKAAIVLKNLSKDTAWLFSNKAIHHRESLVKNLENLATGTKYMTNSGKWRLSKLINEMSDFLPASVLESLGYMKDRANFTQVLTYFIHYMSTRSISPVLFLLLLQFLELDCEYFFTTVAMDNVSRSFGIGPWPCLNPVCTNYKKNSISIMSIKLRNEGTFWAYFKCHCGFMYGKDIQSAHKDDIYWADKIIEYGEVWDTELRRMWNSPEYNLMYMADRLQLDRITVKRNAQRLELSFEIEGRRYSKPEPLTTYGEHSIQKRDKIRLEWKEALEANPDHDYQQIIKDNSELHRWLGTNDSGSLFEDAKTKRSIHRTVDWNQRQELYLPIVDEAVRKLTEKDIWEKPIRITRKSIAQQVSQDASTDDIYISTLTHSTPLGNMPELKAYMYSKEETHESFAIRRLKIMAERYIAEKIIPARSLLMRRAGIGPNVGANWEVQHTVTEVLDHIERALSSLSS